MAMEMESVVLSLMRCPGSDSLQVSEHWPSQQSEPADSLEKSNHKSPTATSDSSPLSRSLILTLPAAHSSGITMTSL